MPPARFILASASPRRSDLLRSLGVQFEVIASRAEELHDSLIGTARLCELNAIRKAEEIAHQYPDAAVLGADTLVTSNGALFGKPRDLKEAFEMLSALSGKTHQVITGVCLMQHAQNRREVFSDLTEVTFNPLSPDTIDRYLQLVPVLDKAGAYGIQDRGEMLVEKISGSLNNVIGLPTEKLSETLRRWGILA